MLSYQNLVVLASLFFYLATKIVSFLFENTEMYKKGTLTSIPELDAEEEVGKKWVPKKKHEVLKAKYKCLKKLFQIYDASVIGILPEQIQESPRTEDEGKDRNRRRKRSHRTKTDACAGTNETTSGDNNSEYENTSVATAIFRELTVDQSCISTQMDAKIDKFAETIDSNDKYEINCQNCHNCQNMEKERLLQEQLLIQNLHRQQCLGFERRKLTRFQCFVQRLFGIRREAYKPEQQMYAASDPILTCREKRRRRGLRFRRIKRAKNVRSESALRDIKNPSILSYVQSVQRHCLMDITPRKCPILGCNMVSYGIINYNDHLNLCHFKDRKYICHYCHEGFETEYDKLVHENGHIGISKLSTNMSTLSNTGQTYKIASITQTEPESNIPEDKLKKIVSFFDKMSDPEQMLTEIKKTRSSETNIISKGTGSGSSGGSASERSDSEQTHTISCCNMRRKEKTSSEGSQSTLVPCHTCCYCGKTFSCRRQLSLHVEREHRPPERCSRHRTPRQVDLVTEEGSINVHTASDSVSYLASVKRVDTTSTLSTRKTEIASKIQSQESLTCDPSTNIIYYTSIDSLEKKQSAQSLGKKPSAVDSLVQKVRSYRWEPGTKIIRV